MDNIFLSEFSSFLALLPKSSFDRGVIIDILRNLTSSNPTFLENPLIFYRDPATGNLQNNLSGSPIIPLGVCTAIAGTGLFNLYNGASARLLTWLAPTLLLMTGMQYAPIGWRKFAMVPHLLSDPIDSAWSLLAKVETWNRCLIVARQLNAGGWESERERNIGIIIGCIEELHIAVKDESASTSAKGGEFANPSLEVHFVDAVPLSAGLIEYTQEVEQVPDGSTIDKLKEAFSTTIMVTDVQASTDEQLTVNTPKGTFSIEQTPFCSCKHSALDMLCSKAAQSILDVRVCGVRQTIFSICAYIVLGIVAAFVPDFGGNLNPSGGKIVTFILLSWLLPNILLSNVVGQFNTSRSCLGAILRFRTELRHLMERKSALHRRCGGVRARRWIAMMDSEDWKTYPDRLAETGSIYSFRLSKQFPLLHSDILSVPISPFPSCTVGTTIPSSHTEIKYTQAHWKLVVLPILPICTSFIAAFIVLWSAPTYFSCRHVMIICIFLTWIISFLLTTYIPRTSLSTKTAFHIILAKDTVLASAILGILISSACGLFNSCFCWSGWWYLRWWTNEPQVQLNPNVQFQQNVRWIYPLVVGLAMSVQLISFMGMIWVGRRVHFGMLRKSEGWLWRTILRERTVRAKDEEAVHSMHEIA